MSGLLPVLLCWLGGSDFVGSLDRRTEDTSLCPPKEEGSTGARHIRVRSMIAGQNVSGGEPLRDANQRFTTGNPPIFHECAARRAFATKGSVLTIDTGTGDSYGAPVVLGKVSGNILFGTTAALGARNGGTIFRLTAEGSDFRVLHHFGDLMAGDGSAPEGGVIEGTDGALYGTTRSGGAHLSGTIFKICKDGLAYTVLYSFQAGGQSRQPNASLIQGSDGRLYGTTGWGGAFGTGTVFSLTKDGSDFQVLYNFLEVESGSEAGLIEGSDGALYGSTRSGGGSNSRGTLFRLNKNSTGYAVLYQFIAAAPDAIAANGAQPAAPLIQGRDGAFYGTTSAGGDMGFPGYGTVFKWFPPETPNLTSLRLLNGNAEVRFTGQAGRQYQLLRSTDLTSWDLLTIVTMPADGSTHLVDDSLPGRSAYYRTLLKP